MKQRIVRLPCVFQWMALYCAWAIALSCLALLSFQVNNAVFDFVLKWIAQFTMMAGVVLSLLFIASILVVAKEGQKTKPNGIGNKNEQTDIVNSSANRHRRDSIAYRLAYAIAGDNYKSCTGKSTYYANHKQKLLHFMLSPLSGIKRIIKRSK